ncbi:MAG: protein-L-isoaspartate O-methyltransferase [Alphaproteobacteria bacterium]
MIDYAAARHQMVDCQVRTNRVTDVALIETLREIPRERFVPQRLRSIAYIDEDLEIAPGRYLMEPMVFARLLQAARVTPTDVALDLAGGTGYGAAVLSRLASTVVAVEADGALSAEAAAALAEVGADNVVTVTADPSAGYADQAPFDVIVCEAALASMPEAVLAQLAEGGRAVAVLRKPDAVGHATLWERHRGHVSHRTLFEAQVPLLPGAAREPSFVF